MDNIFLDQFDQFYSHLLELADLARRFDDEKIDMSGLTFRTLMEESATLVIANYVTIQEHCENQWNFHSAFFFAGTVGEDAQITEYLEKPCRLEHAHEAAALFLVCSIIIFVSNYYGTNKKNMHKVRVPVPVCSTRHLS